MSFFKIINSLNKVLDNYIKICMPDFFFNGIDKGNQTNITGEQTTLKKVTSRTYSRCLTGYYYKLYFAI